MNVKNRNSPNFELLDVIYFQTYRFDYLVLSDWFLKKVVAVKSFYKLFRIFLIIIK